MSTAGSPVKVVFDTSVYIPFINSGIMHPTLAGQEFRAVHYMSAVVLAELYAGAVDKESVRLLDRIYDTFMGTSRLIVPDAADWKKAGFLMAKLGKKYGFERNYISRLQNDILVALAARKTGAYVVTGNVKDFRRIREFLDFKLFE